MTEGLRWTRSLVIKRVDELFPEPDVNLIKNIGKPIYIMSLLYKIAKAVCVGSFGVIVGLFKLGASLFSKKNKKGGKRQTIKSKMIEIDNDSGLGSSSSSSSRQMPLQMQVKRKSTLRKNRTKYTKLTKRTKLLKRTKTHKRTRPSKYKRTRKTVFTARSPTARSLNARSLNARSRPTTKKSKTLLPKQPLPPKAFSEEYLHVEAMPILNSYFDVFYNSPIIIPQQEDLRDLTNLIVLNAYLNIFDYYETSLAYDVELYTQDFITVKGLCMTNKVQLYLMMYYILEDFQSSGTRKIDNDVSLYLLEQIASSNIIIYDDLQHIIRSVYDGNKPLADSVKTIIDNYKEKMTDDFYVKVFKNTEAYIEEIYAKVRVKTTEINDYLYGEELENSELNDFITRYLSLYGFMNMGIEFLEDKMTPVDSLLLNKFHTPVDSFSSSASSSASGDSSSSKYYTPEGSLKDITV